MDVLLVVALVLLGLCFLSMIVLYYLMYRNYKLCQYRIDLVNRDMALYDTLPSYNDMMYHYKPLKDKCWLNQKNICISDINSYIRTKLKG
jgi:hypothetical protein